MGTPNFLYVRNRRDNDLESTRGNYTTVEGGVAGSYFGSEADFSRMLVKNSSYHTLFRNRSTAGDSWWPARPRRSGEPVRKHGSVGSLAESGSGRNAGSFAGTFFSGGGNSHRGFGLNQAGPRDPFTGFPVGGSAVFLNNLELRLPNVTVPYLLENIGFTIFHDMGNVFARPQGLLPSLLRIHQPNQQVCFQPPAIDQGPIVEMQLQLPLARRRPGSTLSDADRPLRFDFGYN